MAVDEESVVFAICVVLTVMAFIFLLYDWRRPVARSKKLRESVTELSLSAQELANSSRRVVESTKAYC